MYRALISFSGKFSMSKGQIREIKDKEIITDLLKAGYIEEIKSTKAETKPIKKKDK